jgi:hypothetical protein
MVIRSSGAPPPSPSRVAESASDIDRPNVSSRDAGRGLSRALSMLVATLAHQCAGVAARVRSG